jgi:hypothetical protein
MFKKQETIREISISSLNYSVSIKSNGGEDFDTLSSICLICLEQTKNIEKQDSQKT